MKKEKEHYNVFVKKHPEQDISTDVQKYLDFGNENAIHAISTCYQYNLAVSLSTK